MITENLVILFDRELQKLKNEMNAYTDIEKIWIIDKQIKNSGGNLCLHLLGNLQHYIGAILGRSGYIRNRPLEFSSKNVSIAEINDLIDKTCKVVASTLNSLTREDLIKEYPEKVFEFATSTEYHLLHLLTHLNYHLGQINYHRRIFDIENGI